MIENELWVEKYRPKKIADVLGNEEAKAAFIDWFKNKHRTRKAVLLYGPPGVGKTTLVNAAANEFGFRVIEMNASDTRNEKAISRVAGPATAFAGLDTFSTESKGNVLFMDEVDGIAGNEDRGGVSTILHIIEQSRIPIIMAANDPDAEKLRPLRKVSTLIRFHEVQTHKIIVLLQKICQKEHVEAEFGALQHIASNSRGDVRSAINDLQSLAEPTKTLTMQDTAALIARNRDIGMEDTLLGYFSAKSFQEASMLLSHVNVDADDLLMAVGDNLPRRYRKAEDLAEAYDFLSRADMYRGRIGVENWMLLKYLFNSLAEAAAVSPGTYRPFEFISPPLRIMSLFWTKGKRTMLEAICGKIGARCHVSRATAKTEFVPFLQVLLARRKASAVAAWLELQPEELELLMRLQGL